MKRKYQNDSFIGLSHRGNSKDFIENSFEAFNSVVEMGYKYIETDLRMTLDRQVIAFHDSDLKRLFGIDFQVNDLTFNEIANLFREKNCKLLTLEDLLRSFPDTKFNIDLKENKVTKDSIDIVSNLDAFHRVCFASFNSSRTKEVLNFNQRAFVSMGLKDVAKFKFFKTHNKNIKFLQIPLVWNGIKVVTKNIIKKAQDKDLLVHVWTINNKKVMNDLIDIGVNGIVTDEPKILMEIMRKKNLISH